MYTVQIHFKEPKLSLRDEFLHAVNALLGSWRMNGQVLGRDYPIAESNGNYSIFVLTPEKNALSSKLNNKHVEKSLKTLEDAFSLPEIAVLGMDPESACVCKCNSSPFYILYTTYVSLESPLKCGGCFGVIPLYKISKTYDDEYYNIICWMSDYQSCDSLQMNCTVGERFATNQLSKFNSALTKSGLSVCATIQEATGKKTYYYLYKGSAVSHQIELERKCPSCHKSWHQEQPLHDIFDFKCPECGLLSNIAWSLR